MNTKHRLDLINLIGAIYDQLLIWIVFSFLHIPICILHPNRGFSLDAPNILFCINFLSHLPPSKEILQKLQTQLLIFHFSLQHSGLVLLHWSFCIWLNIWFKALKWRHKAQSIQNFGWFLISIFRHQTMWLKSQVCEM